MRADTFSLGDILLKNTEPCYQGTAMNPTDKEGKWQCEKKNCGFINSNDTVYCMKCRASKPLHPLARVGQEHSNESPTGHSFELTSLGATSLDYSFSSIKLSAVASSGSGASNYEEVIPFPGQVCRMVLMGKTGNGKSSTGNTIVAEKRFAVGDVMVSETRRCQWHNTKRFGINIEVVDTPGFFDTKDDDVTVRKEVMKCVGMVSPGPHALLLVVRLDVRFTDEEAKSVQEVRDLFGDKIMRHVIIVFTHGDLLEESGDGKEKALQKSLANLPDKLEKLMKEVDNRYVVFNNRACSQADKDKQVRQLLSVILRMLATTDDEYYSTPFLQQCEETVMTHATQLGALLNSRTVNSETLRRLLRAGLEGRETLEQLLHTVLDEQASLQESLKVAQETQRELEEKLRKKKAKWKCW